MKKLFLACALLVVVAPAAMLRAAEITDVIDAADGDDPFDFNIDINFSSTLNRSKITHEWSDAWTDTERPDYNELRYQQQIYRMDYMIEIGLYHDLELYVNLPWIISDKKSIGYVKGVSGTNSTLYRPGATENALGVDPSTSPEVKRAGIGDMKIGVKWAPFNDERVDTESVWVFGLEYTIPSGSLNDPQQAVGGGTGGVGMGHHILTPYIMFSHRFKVLDPYVGVWGSIPIQGKEAKKIGLTVPYQGGFFTGLEIVPWENPDKHQKFAIDVRLTSDFIAEADSNGEDNIRGTITELTDFLACYSTDCTSGGGDPATLRQVQYQSNFARFGAHLGFTIRAAEFVRFRAGVSLEHQTEHFLSGADPCLDSNGDGDCTGEQPSNYFNRIYDLPGKRIRVEETTLFTYWVTGMVTF
ncbi:MAG: hypothetical protein D6806_16105 [Deltaproteobacteria bacterium]|nr:MAG: hypothetical protein D6806_16105 [Deltaproteobacteria bacterium]